jgi:hypothetical protein
VGGVFDPCALFIQMSGSMAMLPLFDEPEAAAPVVRRRAGVDDRPKSHRVPEVRPGHPCYFAYWSGFNRGRIGHAAPAAEADEDVTRYARDGYRLGCVVNWKPPKEHR